MGQLVEAFAAQRNGRGRHVALTAGDRFAEPRAAGVRHLAFDVDLLGVGLGVAPLRLDADFAEDVALVRLALESVLDALADREAGRQHEAAEDDAQSREQRSQLLLPHGRQR